MIRRAKLENPELSVPLGPTQNFSSPMLKQRQRSRVPVGLFGVLERIVSSAEEMSELLQCQFESVFSILKNISPGLHGIEEFPPPVLLSDINITRERILDSIMATPISSAPGPDEVPLILLRKCAEVFSIAVFM